MTNRKQYDRTELLDKAVELFRRQGFNGTSTAELVEELGVNRKSMYAEFGSKQGLFEAALERYDDHHLSRVLSPIESPNAGVTAIREALAGYGRSAAGWARGKGCLMCNTAVERGALARSTGGFVDRYLDRLIRAFRHALENSRRAGEIDASVDVDELAAFFATTLIGVAASIRAEAPPKQVEAACRVATAVLDANSSNRPDERRR